MRILAGTSGFSYAAWKGPFYPEKFPAKEMLSFYAGRLPAVEINNTFYRMPKASVLEGWAAQVPEGFRFVLKASRRITHQKRLKDVGEETAYLVRTAGVLGERLGALLFQLPPFLRADRPRLEAFLDLLPEDGERHALEFRHPSWLEDGAVVEALRARGVAVVGSDTEEAPLEALLETGPRGYLRLRRADYVEADLAAWAKRVRAAGWDEAFVFFKHEDAAAGPRMAETFLDLCARLAAPGRAARRAPARRDEAAPGGR